MKLIDKAALVAEVEKIREHVIRLRYAVDANCIVTIRNACECLESSIDLLVNSIDTLEVKEVDLDTEIMKYQREIYDRDTTVRDVAKHFFELGLNAQRITMEKIKLYLDQLDNGWVLQDETDTQNSSAEIVKDKDIRYQLGLAILDYVRSAMDEVASNACEIELTVNAVPSRLIKAN